MVTDRNTRQYQVEIEGITEPATFSRLPEALSALWAALRVLPLGWTQYEAYRYFFGEGSAERVKTFLDRDGQLSLSFQLEGRAHAVHVRPV
ncbi:hypothetical protein ACGFX4_20065 [Kitasatospora sp. NPDC048365]|uniref:hypothetical protein n=1 Tax=Kitasatospora sp. NPDC048365 TaxID=3364050 RepID=UPI003713325C